MLSAGPAFGYDTRWKNCASWWGPGLDRRGLELDIVAESPDEEVLLVGEAKLTVSAQERAFLETELKRKAENLPFGHSYKKVITKLFVASDYE